MANASQAPNLIKSNENSFNNVTVLSGGQLIGSFVYVGEFEGILCYPVTINNNFSLYAQYSDNGTTILKEFDITTLNYSRVIAPYFRIRFVNNSINSDLVSMVSYLSTQDLSAIDEQLNIIIQGISSIEGELNNISNDNITTNNKLDTINTSITTTNNKLDTINTSITTTNNKLDDSLINQLKSLNLQQQGTKYNFYGKNNELILNSPDGVTAYADSVPVPIIDTYKREGWYYTNTSAGNKYNYYYFSGATFQIQAQNVIGQFVIFENDALSSRTDLVPIIAIYTIGNNQGWYNARRTYSISQNIQPGVKYLAYYGSNPGIFPELPRIQLNLSNTTGIWNNSDLILTMSIGSNSGTPINEVKNLTYQCGYVSTGNITTTTTFIGSTKNINTEVQILDNITTTNNKIDTLEATTQLIKTETISANQNLAIIDATLQDILTDGNKETTQIDIKDELITLNNKNLALDDTVASVDANILLTNSKLDDLNTSTNNIEAQINKLTFDINNNLLVSGTGGGGSSDASAANQLIQISEAQTTNTYLDTIATKLNGNINNNIFDGSGNAIDSTIYITNRRALSVSIENNVVETSVNNFPTSYAQEITLTATNNKIDNVNNNLSTLNSTQSTSMFYLQDIKFNSNDIKGYLAASFDSVNNRINTNVLNNVSITNSDLSTIATNTNNINNNLIDIKTELTTGTLDTNITNSYINSRIYGSHDGNTYHHILTTPQGKIVNNSSTQDGDGNNINSVLYNLTTGNRALCVSVENTDYARESTSQSINNKIVACDTTGLATNSKLIDVENILTDIKINTDNIDTSTTSIDTSTNNIELSTSSIDTKMTTNNNILTTINDSCDNIETSTGSIDSKITTTNNILTTLNTSCDNIETSTASIDTKMTTNNNILTTINDSCDNIEIATAAINSKISTSNNTIKTSLYDSTGTNLTSKSQGLRTALDVSLLDSNGTGILSTSNSLNIYQSNVPSVYKIIYPISSLGTRGNLLNNVTLNASASSTALNCANFTRTIISYQDSLIASSGTITIEVSIDGTNYNFLGRLIPIRGGTASLRTTSAIIDLGPFSNIRVTNDSADNFTNVLCSVFGWGQS